ncbi:MAG: hypothetical protein K9N11_04665 [Lentisphaeria bacterium]|nr:hypothetical protein [Candidatus Neomarinimicrobiota bacterium]MCF7842127.1 hypothetical protein [Lentisphaeria bacterium]
MYEIVREPVRTSLLHKTFIFALTYLLIGWVNPVRLRAQTLDNEQCLTCHGYRSLERIENEESISLYVDRQVFNHSVHNVLSCTDCHEDALPQPGKPGHSPGLQKVACGNCHRVALQQYSMSLHDKRVAGGEELAPMCQTCHGSHDIKPLASPESNVRPIKIPALCGSCHHEGTEVSVRYNIPQDKILENYSQSMHGEGLLKKGLTVSATCVSCHTAHRILPHTDPRSTIAKQNIASTCSNCHTEIERVHQKVIRGQLWETEPHKLPACVDCHQPHKVRKSFYIEGIADEDCQKCHADQEIKSSLDGRSLFVDKTEISHSRHAQTACSQCHINVDPRHDRPCETLTEPVDCSICHESQGEDFRHSIHGELVAKNDPNGPSCTECHGDHSVQGRANPDSPIFPTNIPNLCGNCHRTGQDAAVRYEGAEKDIVFNYIESIHGKGLLKSGLTVTATCTNCHTAHREQPASNPNSSVHPNNIAGTCGECHMGVEATFLKSIHSPMVSQTDERLPVCSTCHSAHTISRTDEENFKLQMMTQCGQCHKEVTESYFDTYHGKVSQLGYTKTAKCYDCHGAHDILPPEDPDSRLSRQNVVETCKTCHPAANRQFAGYLTHATHHDPVKYPILFWTFWAMTGLLTVTFLIAGLHTLLWLPRSFQWKRELRRRLAAAEQAEQFDGNTDEENNEQQ